VNWTRTNIAGRTVEVFAPSFRPDAAVIWLHDYDESPLSAVPAAASAFAVENLLVVCPNGGRLWWLDCQGPGFGDHTPARFILEAVVGWIDATHGIAPPAIGLSGVGMGGQGAVNLGFRNARRFPVVAAIAPDIDFHQWHGQGTPLDELFSSREAARQQTATLHLHPLNWPRNLLLMCDPADPIAWEGTERLASKLISSGVPFECDFESRGRGHDWTSFADMIPTAARFLGQHLRAARSALQTSPD
jgi:S-formylglutathione hydrolase